MNILLVDNEKDVLNTLEKKLTEEGHEVFKAIDGEAALEIYRNYNINLVVVDLLLPKITGFEVVDYIRTESDIPIVILTSLDDDKIKIKGFDKGADDYITKPFSLPILLKRIKAILKRNYESQDIWKWKQSKVDFNRYEAMHMGESVDVKPKEIDVLKYLLANANRVVSRGEILEYLWNDNIPYERVIDVYIKNLRKKLKLDCIITIVNVGYKLCL